MHSIIIVIVVLFFCPSTFAGPPAELEQLMNEKISVFDLYLGDLKNSADSTLSMVTDKYNPSLADVRYYPSKDLLYLFFTLNPDSTTIEFLLSASQKTKMALLEDELINLATFAGVEKISGLDQSMGILQLTPLKTINSSISEKSDKLKNMLANRTVVLISVSLDGQKYTLARDLNGTIFKKSKISSTETK